MASERGMLAASSAELALKGDKPHASLSPFSWNEDGLLSLHASGCSRNVGFAAFVQSTVDESALQKSLESLVSRHNQLRTAFIPNDGVLHSGLLGAGKASDATRKIAFTDGTAIRSTADPDEVRLDFEIIPGGQRQMEEAQRALIEPFDLAAPVKIGTSLLRVRLVSAEEATLHSVGADKAKNHGKARR